MQIDGPGHVLKIAVERDELDELRKIQKDLTVTGAGKNCYNKATTSELKYKDIILKTTRHDASDLSFVMAPDKTKSEEVESSSGKRQRRPATGTQNVELYKALVSVNMQSLYKKVAETLAALMPEVEEFHSDLFILVTRMERDQDPHTDSETAGENYWTVGLGPVRTTQFQTHGEYAVPVVGENELLAWDGDAVHRGTKSTAGTQVRMFMTFWDKESVENDRNVQGNGGQFVPFLQMTWNRHRDGKRLALPTFDARVNPYLVCLR